MSNLNFLHSGGNKVILSAPDNNPSSDVTFKLPQADGSNGQLLGTNGSGTLSFVNSQNDYPVFFARNNNTQSIPNNTSTKIQFVTFYNFLALLNLCKLFLIFCQMRS